MASQIVHREAELIPSLELPDFSKAVSTLEAVEQELVPISQAARSLKIDSASDFARAGEMIAALKAFDKGSEATMAPYKAKVKLVSDFIRTRLLRVANKVEETKGILTPKMAEWTRKEQAAAKAEQDRLQAIETARLKREAQEKQQKDEEAAAIIRKAEVANIRADLKSGKITKRQAEKLLKLAGAIEEAAKVNAACEAEEATANAAKTASQLKVAANVPTVAGVVKRVNYKFHVIDENKIPREYLTPNLVKIGEFVRAAKKVGEVLPGIEAFEDRTF